MQCGFYRTLVASRVLCGYLLAISACEDGEYQANGVVQFQQCVAKHGVARTLVREPSPANTHEPINVT